MNKEIKENLTGLKELSYCLNIAKENYKIYKNK